MCENLANNNGSVTVSRADIDVDTREAGDETTNLPTTGASALTTKPQVPGHFCPFLSLKPKMKVVSASNNQHT